MNGEAPSRVSHAGSAEARRRRLLKIKQGVGESRLE
jgi:hypothetical protein